MGVCGHHVEGRIRCGRVQAGMQMLLQSVCRWGVLLCMHNNKSVLDWTELRIITKDCEWVCSFGQRVDLKWR